MSVETTPAHDSLARCHHLIPDSNHTCGQKKVGLGERGLDEEVTGVAASLPSPVRLCLGIHHPPLYTYAIWLKAKHHNQESNE